MRPVINFSISYYLQSEIIGSYYDGKKLFKFLRKFSNYFKKIEQKTLMLIEKYTGFKWKQTEINVWLFEGWKPSISTPLLLNVYGYEVDFTYFNLVHELVHNNIAVNKLVIKNDLELEALVSLVTKMVMLNFYKKSKVNKLCSKAEFGGLYKYVWKREIELEKKINLNEMSIKHYIKNGVIK